MNSASLYNGTKIDSSVALPLWSSTAYILFQVNTLDPGNPSAGGTELNTGA